jgi:hypothetical protein
VYLPWSAQKSLHQKSTELSLMINALTVKGSVMILWLTARTA